MKTMTGQTQDAGSPGLSEAVGEPGKDRLGKVDELLDVLDGDIARIQQNLLRLNKLRILVIKRDDVSLSRLLESIYAESDSYKNCELKRQSLRRELADALGCSLEEMTLSRLETAIGREKRQRIIERKVKLGSLIEELRREVLSTSLLLSECARFNNLLLKNILGFDDAETVTYNSSGSASRQSESALVNFKF